MSLFTRTVADVDALEASIKALTEATDSIDVRKQSLTTAQQSLESVQPTVKKFVTKADLGEKDPNKRLYGTAMVTKIRNLDQRLTTISTDLASLAETIDTEFTQFQLLREKEEAQRKAAEEEKQRLEQQRKADEERARKEEEARIEADRLEKEAELKRQQQAEEDARKEREAQEKKRAEQEAIAKQQKEAEEAAAAAKLDEEKKAAEEARLAAEALEREKAKQAAISVTIKTTRGKVLSLTAVPPDCTVGKLKKIIQDQHTIPAASQRLIFQGRLLADAKTIDSYKIANGSAVHLVENNRAAAAGSRSIPSVPKPIVPPGTVCHLENGKDQFESISQNCGKRRLIVVDWSASWCGPCRMIAPVFERLATRFSDVTFIKVDTEASAANTLLASEKGISGYPTFHFYIDGRLVRNFSGANASRIEAGIKECRAMVEIPDGASSSAARASAGPSASGALTQRVLSALRTLRNNCTQQDFVVAVRTLLTFVRNVAENPGQEKYRKVRTANNTFQTRLASKAGGMDCMRAFGFEEMTENGSSFLVLPAEAAANPELGTIKAQLEQALAAATGDSQEQSQSASTSATRNTEQQAPSPAAAPPFGNLPGGMLGGMDTDAYRSAMMEMMITDPGFAQVASELAADPTAVESLVQVQRAIESGDPSALQQIQSNPSLARLQQAIASNPTFLNAMMRQMVGDGFPGMPGMQGMAGMNNQGAGGNVGTGGNTGTGENMGTFTPNQAANANPTPAYPGAPTTAEEEERLLQEAIRLSMQESNPNPNQGNKGDDENPQDKED